MRHFPGFNLQVLLNVQFGIIGTASIGRLLSPFLSRIPALPGEKALPEWLIHEEDGSHVTISGADVMGGILGLACVLLDLHFGHRMHTVNNLIACCLAVEILQVSNNIFPVALFFENVLD